MDFDTVIAKRASVRSFKNKKASWKQVLEAIDAALQAPFAGNHNNLRFLIVENPETIKKIAEFSEQSWITEAGILVLVCSDDQQLENMYGERGSVYSRQQAGAAIQTFLLKLVDLDFAACWVGAYADELVKQLLNIPQHIQIEALVPVGYEKTPHAKKRKKALENALFWERWEQDKRPLFFDKPDVE